MVGLGTIARTHLEVLDTLDEVTVAGGVDPVVSGQRFRVHRTVAAALTDEPAPDLVVVATPTETHTALVREIVDSTHALVLSEKPLATSLADLATVADVAERVRVAHHFAFSPEVEWALQHVRTSGWGHPTRVTSIFNDAYAGLDEARLASYVSSWIDSAPNQLSLLAPFIGPCALVSHSDERLRAVTVLDHEGGRTVLASNWLAGDSSKQTTLEYDGDRAVRMDHTSMTVTVLDQGLIAQHVGYAGTVSRKHAHYRGLYDVLLTDPDDERLGVSLARDIARLLEAAESASPGATRWTS